MQPSTKSRKASPPLKSLLLDEAFALLDQVGPEGVTIRAVARGAGVSHAAPANHFADRKQLLTEMASVIFAQYLAQVDRRTATKAEARSRAYLAGLIDYALAYPGRYQLLWRKDLVDWENALFLGQLNQAYEDFLQVLGTTTGLPANGQQDIETLGTAAWAMAHGYAVLRSTGIFELRLDSATGKPRMEAMLDLLLGCSKSDR